MTRRMVVAGVLAALWCGSAAADVQIGPGGGITTNTGLFSVSEPTTYTHTTNIYLHSEGYGAIDANLTLKDSSYVRLVGGTSKAPARGLYIATNANADLTINITGKSALYMAYRNSGSDAVWGKTGMDPAGKDTVPSYIDVHLGIANGGKDTTGRAQFVSDTIPSFGSNAKVSLWVQNFYIDSSVSPHDTGYIDFLKLDSGAEVDLAYIYQNNANYPARILFNGGALRNHKCLGDSKNLPFRPATGTELVLHSVDGKSIIIARSFSSDRRALNAGMGTLRFDGDGDVIIRESGGNLAGAGTSDDNCWPVYIDTTKGPVVWDQGGEIVLELHGLLMLDADNQLPADTRMRFRATSSYHPIFDPNGKTQCLQSLVSEAAGGLVTNLWASKEGKAAESLLVFGTNDMDGVFSAKCCDHVNIEKVGSGTLVISNSTVDVNATGTGKVEIKEGTVVFSGTNKIGTEDMYGSERCIISNGVKVIKEIVVNVASGKTTTQSAAYADTDEYTVRLRKTGAGTLVLNQLNNFSEGLVIDEGIVKVTAVGAQGTSNIVVNCDASVNRAAQIKFATCPPNGSAKMIYTNDIYVTGSSAFTYSSNYNEDGAICFAQTNQVLQGSITAAADLSIVDSKDGSIGQDAGKMQNNVGGIVKGPVTVNGDLHFNSGYKSYFYGPVTANIWWNRKRNGCRGAIYLCSTNTVGTYKTECNANCKIYSNCNDSLKGSKLDWTRADAGATMRGSVHIVNANGETEVISISGVDTCRKDEEIGNSTYGYGMMGYSVNNTKLTIVGEENAATRFCGIIGKKDLTRFTLHLNAPDSFTQTFSNVYYLADGELKVSSGTMIIDGKSYFPNLTTITVEGDGVLDIRGLGTVSNQTINCMPALTTLNVASSAKLKLAEGIAITSTVVKVDGYQLYKGEYASGSKPGLNWLEGKGTIVSTSWSKPSTSEDAVWSGGAGEDVLTTTAANWADSPMPAFYYRGYRPVFGEGGGEAKFPSGVSYLSGLKFSRDADFTVSGVDDTTSLDLSAGITIAGTNHTYTIGVPVVQSVASTITLTSNTTVKFEREYKVTGNFYWNRNADTIGSKLIFNGPVIASGEMRSGLSFITGAFTDWYPTVVFGAAGNKASLLGFGYTHVQFMVDNAFDNTPFTVRGGTITESTVRFNGTRQQTPNIVCPDGKGWFAGNYPSTLAITNGWTDRATAVSKKFGPSVIDGWLKLEKSGDGYHLLGRVDGGKINYTSYGDLEVSGGTLEILPNATWLNGTNIIVKGTGQLILADPAKTQIGSQAVFHFGNDAGDTESKLVATNGLTYQVEAIYLGDNQLPAGIYDGSSDEQLSGRITGGGSLRVKHGTMFIFR